MTFATLQDVASQPLSQYPRPPLLEPEELESFAWHERIQASRLWAFAELNISNAKRNSVDVERQPMSVNFDVARKPPDISGELLENKPAETSKNLLTSTA